MKPPLQLSSPPRRDIAPPKIPEHHLSSCVAIDAVPQGTDKLARIEGAMATKQHGQIVETPTEARQAEPGPSVFALLVVSTGLAILILGVFWFVFFRT